MQTDGTVERASEQLADLLFRGEYLSGDKLPTERQLAVAFAVSRSTMREAIRRLSAEGMLVARQGSGTYVADLDLDSVFAVRLQLEPYAAHEAAARRSGEQLAHLMQLLETLRSRLDDARAFAEVDHAMHRAIAEATSNLVLHDVLGRLSRLTRISRRMTSPEERLRLDTLERMSEVVNAIARQNGKVAEAAMRGHLESVRIAALAQRVPARPRFDSG